MLKLKAPKKILKASSCLFVYLFRPQMYKSVDRMWLDETNVNLLGNVLFI